MVGRPVKEQAGSIRNLSIVLKITILFYLANLQTCRTKLSV